jgi:hypothetical protein
MAWHGSGEMAKAASKASGMEAAWHNKRSAASKSVEMAARKQ